MNWDLMNFLATSALTIAIYWLQRSHEKEREQMEVEAQKKAVVEAARVFPVSYKHLRAHETDSYLV